MKKRSQPVVYIVDDDSGMRNSLRMLAEAEGLLVHTYESAEEFVAETNEPTHPGCVVLDLRMPGMGGLALLQRLRTNMNDIPVILMSAHADVPDTVRGMKLGAVDLLQKPVEPSFLIDAIRRSLLLSQSLYGDRAEADSLCERFAGLTARELELLQLLVDGRSNKQIASDMGIATKTAANHRASLMAKTNAANAADLARLFTIYKSVSRQKTPNLRQPN
jgi:two-component system response regulator FixJ